MSQRPSARLLSVLLFLLAAAPALADDPTWPRAGRTGQSAAGFIAGGPPCAIRNPPVDLSAPRCASAAAKAATPIDLAKQLADTQDKLSTALHSYTLLQDENTQLKADAEKSVADKTAVDAQLAGSRNNAMQAALKSQAASCNPGGRFTQPASPIAESDCRPCHRKRGVENPPGPGEFGSRGHNRVPTRLSAEGCDLAVAPAGPKEGESPGLANPATTSSQAVHFNCSPRAAANVPKAEPQIYTAVCRRFALKISKKFMAPPAAGMKFWRPIARR